uniref:Uncharacterized protein n=1 Tax=viral metagenome TaxID=1070528 RepID=A0A6H1ZCZ9_9ZZZZ
MKNSTSDSIMEERAAQFSSLYNPTTILLPQTDYEIREEISLLKEKLRELYLDTSSIREALKSKEKLFLSLATYKMALERSITPVIRIPSLRDKRREEREREDMLLERLESLSPEEFALLEEIEL